MALVSVNRYTGRMEMSSEFHSRWEVIRYALSSSSLLFRREVFENEDERCVVQAHGHEFEVVWERDADGRTIASVEVFESLFDALQCALDTLGINSTKSDEFFEFVKTKQY